MRSIFPFFHFSIFPFFHFSTFPFAPWLCSCLGSSIVLVEPLRDKELVSLPVFPLPSIVLFPGTALPLHVFEARYLSMVRGVMREQGAIGIVRLCDDVDPQTEQPPLFEVGCAGRIVHVDEVGEGRLNILVHGLDRVRLGNELQIREGYRRFNCEPLQTLHDDDANHQLARLQSCLLSLRSSAGKQDHELVEILNSTSDPLQLADILSAVLIQEPDIRQTLLAEKNLGVRLRTLIDQVAEVLVQVGGLQDQHNLN
jgi:uncharacterized protein